MPSMSAPPAPAPPAPEPSLDELARLTTAITTAQQEVNDLSQRRLAMIKALHATGVQYKDMATAMGVTVQTVYRIAPLGREK